MKKLGVITTLLALCILGLLACTGKGQPTVVPVDASQSGITSQTEVGDGPGNIPQGTFVKHIVVLKPGVSQLERDSLAGSLTKPASHVFNTVFVGFSADISASELQVLTADGRVAYVEEDQVVSLCRPVIENNPDSDPWDIRDDLLPTVAAEPTEGPIRFEGDNPADWGVMRINAFPSPGLQGAGLTVAIIDTGIDTDHPDLAGSLVAEYDAVGDVEGAGTAEDLHGHGTHVAGIVGARDNDIGTVGVAPLCSFAAVKVFAGASGSGPNSDLIRGIDWVAANQSVVSPPIKVVNMSLSGTGTSRAMYDAVQACNDLGITTVVAAGNDFRDASQQMPANFDNVITVSAMRRVWNAGAYDYRFATFSNFGNTVDLIAPGQQILSLRNDGTTRYMSGTSMACPHVAGIAALYLDENLADGFQETYDALIADGEAGSWSGDPDGVYEPLVHTAPPTWHTLSIAPTFTVNTGDSFPLAIINGNPAISFMGPNMDLMFVRADNTLGSVWATPVFVGTTGGDNASMIAVNGNPAISFQGGLSQKYVRALDTIGSSWGTPFAFEGVGRGGSHSSMKIVSGNPAIAYFDSINDDLKYVRAIDANGSAWGEPIGVDTIGATGQTPSMAIVDGNPAISYWGIDSTNILLYIRAIDSIGSTWEAPITIDNRNCGSHSTLDVVNGNPAICYKGGFLSDWTLNYIRATNAKGSAWGSPLGVTSDTRGYDPLLAIVNGHPATCYYEAVDKDLKYVKASNTDGGAWEPSQLVDSAGEVGRNGFLAEVNSNPAISYYDETNQYLKFAYYGP